MLVYCDVSSLNTTLCHKFLNNISTASTTIVAELIKDNRLNGDNYEIWTVKVRYVLEEKEASDPLETIMVQHKEELPLNIGMTVKPMIAWKKKNTTARIITLAAINDDIAKQF